MKIVTLALNPLDPETWTTHEVADVRDFLMQQFDEMPSTARIYNEQVSSATDVTPSNEAEIERLGELNGPFYIIVYPADPVTILYAIVAILVVAVVVMAQNQPPLPTLRNTQNQSPNNELSERSNKPRPNARIPDIFGTVRSTPDLISVPYKIFVDNEEVEYAYMCIGRGEYEIDPLEIYDDTTRIIDIGGASVEVYKPFTSPNSNVTPQLRIGTAINTPVYTAIRSNAVNGQVLRSPNDQSLVGNNNIYFAYPNEIRSTNLNNFDFSDKFVTGDILTLSNAFEYATYSNETKTIFASNDGSFKFSIPNTTLPSVYSAGKQITITGAQFSYYDPDGYYSASYDLSGVYTISSVNLVTETITPEFGSPYDIYFCRIVLSSPASVNPKWAEAISTVSTSAALKVPNSSLLYDLSGTYTVLAVSVATIRLSNPAAINSAWSSITTTNAISPTLSTTGDKWVGPYVLEGDEISQIFANFVALNGLYKDDGQNQYYIDVTLELEVTPLNDDDSPRGAVQTFQTKVYGSSTFKSTRAATLKAALNVKGRCAIRARRVTPSDLAFKGSVVDEIKWRDAYGMASLNVDKFYGFNGGVDAFTPWGGASSSLVSSGGKLVVSYVSGSNYGAQVAVGSIQQNKTITVTFTLSDFSGISFVEIGLQGGGSGWASVTNYGKGAGTYTLNLVTSRDIPYGAYILFYVNTPGGSFALDDVTISVGRNSLKSPHFGNVTTVQAVTYATAGALAVKDRKLNLEVTRKISRLEPEVTTKVYTFDSNVQDFLPWGNTAAVTQSGGKLITTYITSGRYGSQVEINPIVAGDDIQITFTLSNIVSPTTLVQIGLQGGGSGWGSNVEAKTAGTHTVTLTAIRDITSYGYILFYAHNSAGGSFALDNVTIVVNSRFPTATNNADDIIRAVCLDKYIGNRNESELDYSSIYGAIAEVRSYFGSNKAAEFCYTFDSNNLSFEETVKLIADSVFCTAYRRGNIIKLSFEKETQDSTLLFNHRNKLPGSETRTIRFGTQENYDGIQYQYIDPDDDAVVTYYIPEDRSAVNPKEIESLGIRNRLQAYFQAWRAWNKIRYQNVITEFTATAEADLLVRNDRILVADNTRPDTQDGEIVSQNVLQLTLSQAVDMTKYAGYSLFIQHTDGMVESIPVTPGASARQVVLSRAPRLPLALDEDLYARATFMLVGNTEPRENAFLVSEKTSQSNFTSVVRAVNYDARYYANDKDYIDGAINENGDFV